MCGRFTLTTADYESVADALEAAFEPEDAAKFRPRFNVAPTDPHPVVVAGEDGRRRLIWAQWGLVSPRDRGQPKPPIHINARAETVATRGFFKQALVRMRCAVVADGFYEWTGPKQARRPIRFHRPDGKPFALAGIALPWQRPGSDETIVRFAIVTTTPNEVVSGVHDRMPAMLDPEDVDAWLRAAPKPEGEGEWLDELCGMLHPARAEALVAEPASVRVNDVHNDDAACLVAEPEVPGGGGVQQTELF